MKKALASLLLAALAGIPVPASAADLPPSGTNTLSGVVRFTNADADILARLGPPGNEGVTSFSVFAYTDPPDSLQSIKSVLSADPLSNPYALTVAANDVLLTYHVYATLTLDDIHEEYWTATQTATPLTSNSPPATVDIDECVALVELRYEDSAGQPVAAQGGRALVMETATGIWRARYLVQPPGRTGNFLVVPSGVEIELAVEVDTGTDIYLDRITHRETHVMTLNCDDKPVITIMIPDPGTLGRITGNANLVGEIEFPTDGYQELLGRPVIKARGPSGNERYSAFVAETPGGDTSRPFALEGLVPSVPTEAWRVQAEMHFGDGYRFEYFITPALGAGLNPGVEVTAGGTTDIGDTFVMNPARLVGTITLTGPPEFGGNLSALRGLVRSSDFDDNMDGIPDYVGGSGINGSYVIATGVDELAPGATLTTAGGQATASFAGAFNPATSAFEGDYEAVLGMLGDQPGVWKYDGINLVFDHRGTNDGPFVNELLYIVEDAPWQGTLAPGESAINDVRYGFAEVCLRIRSPAPFFYPRVVNTYGYHTNYDGGGNVLNSYRAILSNASSPPYTADAATNEAIVTMYLPAGSYTLQPAFSVPDPDGGISEVQLPIFNISVVAGERLCVEECIQVFIEPPICTPNFGFFARANAVSCDGTLTNLSLRASPLSNPSIRLGYSDIRILAGFSSNNLTTAHGLFPDFDGFPMSYYEDILYTATALDNTGRVATRQIIAHYDFTPPTINCPADITVTSPEGAGVPVEFTVTATDNRPEPLRITCDPPSGSVFPIGTTTVTCYASDLCHNTNTCTFQITVRPPDGDCLLRIALTSFSPPMLTLTWDCPAMLQYAPNVDGPWSNVTGATSPHAVAADAPHQFYRLCLSGDCGTTPPTPTAVYEPFDYPTDTTLADANGGTGFAGAWDPAANLMLAGTSLAFAPLNTSGGSGVSPGGYFGGTRSLTTPIGDDGTTAYLSFVLRPGDPPPERGLEGYFGISLFGTNGQGIFVGKPGGQGGVVGDSTHYLLEDFGGTGQAVSDVIAVANETVLLVVKCEFAAGNDTFTLYVNPATGAPEPATGVTKSNADLSRCNAITISSGYEDSGAFSIDEIRLGETFQSVTPSP